MKINKELKVTGFIVRDGKVLKRDEMTKSEQLRLADNWNRKAMETIGYKPMIKT